MTPETNDPIVSQVHRSPRQWQAYLEAQAQRRDAIQRLLPEIVADGYSRAQAEAWISAAIHSRVRGVAAVLGISFLLLCSGVSTFVAAMQAQPGTTSYLWVGAIIFGAIGLVYGLSRLVIKH